MTSICVRVGTAAVVSGLLLISAAANAAELTVLSVGSLRSSLTPLLSGFEKSSGYTVKMESGAAGAMVSRIQKGEVVDVVIVTPPQIAALLTDRKIVAGTQVRIAKVGMGLGASPSAVNADVSSMEAFRRTLLAAKSIGQTDPSGGASSAIYTAKLLGGLDIAADLKPKIKMFRTNDELLQALGNGDVELGFGQMTEIAAAPHVRLVGPLPAPIQNYTVYETAVVAAAKEPDAAKAFVRFLTSPATVAAMRERGVQSP